MARNVFYTAQFTFLRGNVLAGNRDNYKVSDEFEIQPDPPLTAELDSLDQLKNIFFFLENYPKYFDDSHVSDRCPLGYLFYSPLLLYLSLEFNPFHDIRTFRFSISFKGPVILS